MTSRTQKRCEHLNEIGLITYTTDREGFFGETELPKRIILHYFGDPVQVEFTKPKKNVMDVGRVLYSKSGVELARISDAVANPAFRDYVMKIWKSLRYKVKDLKHKEAQL